MARALDGSHVKMKKAKKKKEKYSKEEKETSLDVGKNKRRESEKEGKEIPGQEEGKNMLKKRKRTEKDEMGGPQKKRKKGGIGHSSHLKPDTNFMVIDQKEILPISGKGVDTDDNISVKRSEEQAKLGGREEQRSAVTEVLELDPDATFVYIGRTGPKHARIKTMSVTLHNQAFEGSGPSKKLAKQDAAMKAVQETLRIKKEKEKAEKKKRKGKNKKEVNKVEREEDVVNNINGDELEQSIKIEAEEIGRVEEAEGQQMGVKEIKRPTKHLRQLVPGIHFMMVSKSGPGYDPKYVMSVEVNNKTYNGTGATQKLAKQAAARKALKKISKLKMKEKQLNKREGNLAEIIPEKYIQSGPLLDIDTSSFSQPPALLSELIMKEKQLNKREGILTEIIPKKYIQSGPLLDIDTSSFSRPPALLSDMIKQNSQSNNQAGILPEVIRDTFPLNQSFKSQPVREMTAATSSTNREKSELRPIVIDGNNVAMNHGRHKCYSVKGIKICIDYFLSRGHKVTAFVSGARRFFQSKSSEPVTDMHLYKELQMSGYLKTTPTRQLATGKIVSCYDDRFILNLAEAQGGIVVTNDQYRDLFNVKPSYTEIIETRLLPYMFVDDIFLPPDDPLGRDGPSLDEFLRVKVDSINSVGGADTTVEEAVPVSHRQIPSLLDLELQPPPAKAFKSPLGSKTIHQAVPSISDSDSPARDQLSSHSPHHRTIKGSSKQSLPLTASGPSRTPPKFGIFDKHRQLKQLGLSQNFDKELVEEALKQCDMTKPVQSDDFIDFLKFMESQKDIINS